MHTRIPTSRKAAGLALVGVVALGASACGSSGGNTTATDTGAGTSTTAGAQPNAAPTPVAQISSLTGEMTQVELEKGFLTALQGLMVTPGVIGSATLNGMTLSFPITGGNATYYTPGTVTPYVQGMIIHNGSGLSLTAGGTTVMLTDFIVDPGASMLYGKVAVNGKVAVEKAPLFFLDGSTLQPLQVENGKAILAGTQVKLTQTAADLLNKTFNTTLVQPTLVGTAKITLDVPPAN